MSLFCAYPGCLRALHAANVSGVCRDHMHSGSCRCGYCRAPRRIVAGKRRRRALSRLRIKTRAELVAEGLLLDEPLFPLTSKGMP